MSGLVDTAPRQVATRDRFAHLDSVTSTEANTDDPYGVTPGRLVTSAQCWDAVVAGDSDNVRST